MRPQAWEKFDSNVADLKKSISGAGANGAGGRGVGGGKDIKNVQSNRNEEVADAAATDSSARRPQISKDAYKELLTKIKDNVCPTPQPRMTSVIPNGCRISLNTALAAFSPDPYHALLLRAAQVPRGLQATHARLRRAGAEREARALGGGAQGCGRAGERAGAERIRALGGAGGGR